MCDYQNRTFVNRNLLWYNDRIKGGFDGLESFCNLKNKLLGSLCHLCSFD